MITLSLRRYSFLATLMAFSMLSYAQSVDDVFTEDGFAYKVLSVGEAGNTVVLSDGTSAVGHVVLPATIDHDGLSYAIVAIGEEAFMGAAITDLDLSEATSLQRIGESAFAECTQLTVVKFPDKAHSSLTEIAPLAFLHCKSLSSFNLEDTRIEVLETLFSKDMTDEISFEQLTTLKLPETLTTLKKYSLQFLDLLEIEIPSGVTTLEDRVLEGCVYLKKVTWKGAQVTSIPRYTFLGDDKLEKVTILTVDPMEPTGLTDRHFYMCYKDVLRVYVTQESYDNLVSAGYDNEKSIFSTLMVYDGYDEVLKGDTNGDGSVNAADIVEVVNYIMGNPSASFFFEAADMNDDGSVNAADIVLIVNTIMSSN